MTSNEIEKMIECKRCKRKHKIIFQPFILPPDTRVCGDQYTHFGICQTTERAVFARFRDEEVVEIG